MQMRCRKTFLRSRQMWSKHFFLTLVKNVVKSENMHRRFRFGFLREEGVLYISGIFLISRSSCINWQDCLLSMQWAQTKHTQRPRILYNRYNVMQIWNQIKITIYQMISQLQITEISSLSKRLSCAFLSKISAFRPYCFNKYFNLYLHNILDRIRFVNYMLMQPEKKLNVNQTRCAVYLLVSNYVWTPSTKRGATEFNIHLP